MRSLHVLLSTSTLVFAAPQVVAADLIVDPAGSPGSYTTIEAAMLAANPDDRLLVMPGHYAGFQWSRAVDVIGMGADPSQVVIESIGYHVSIPVLDYDTTLSNVTVSSSDPLQSLVISGNELPPGTLVIDGCVIEGGVFLRGGETGFYLQISNSKMTPSPGSGFGGASTWVGGPNNTIEIRNSEVRGADSDASQFAPATSALLINGGSNVIITDSRILGGDGNPGNAPYVDGADGVIKGGATPVRLRLDGGAIVRGGDAAGLGAGGDGVAVNGTIEVGDATVGGGAGLPQGVPYALSSPVAIQGGLHLAATPNLHDANAPVFIGVGDTLGFSFGAAPDRSVMIVAFDLDLPLGGFPMTVTSPWVVVPGNSLSAQVPSVPGLSAAGFYVFAQGFTMPLGSPISATNTATMRVDLLNP